MKDSQRKAMFAKQVWNNSETMGSILRQRKLQHSAKLTAVKAEIKSRDKKSNILMRKYLKLKDKVDGK